MGEDCRYDERKNLEGKGEIARYEIFPKSSMVRIPSSLCY